MGSALALQAQLHLPLEIRDGETQEQSTLLWHKVTGCRTPISMPAAVGEGWRTDGYSSGITVPVEGIIPNNGLDVNMRDSAIISLTASVWCAVETYPMMTTATARYDNPLYTDIVGNINDSTHTGFAFQISNLGRLRFRCYSSGWQIICESPHQLPLNEWHHLVATIDGYHQRVRLYDNGNLVAEQRCMYTASLGTQPLLLGRSSDEVLDGIFPLNYFNGMIDEVRVDTGIWNDARIAAEVAPEHPLNMSVPIEAYADDILRPRYHGMPSQGWTNESHGLIFRNGRWHVFFQKNGNGPYMARLHWGHISSPDLCHWTEEPVALMPAESYDIKGCWSGCVFTDPDITGGEPNILYSAIDDSHCELMLARPLDGDLRRWEKLGKPGIRSSFRDDFRDPYVFRHNNRPYIIVGCAENGTGIATLQRYENGNWTSDGDKFFAPNPVVDPGNFWEMPNVTPMGGDRWLFTVTPMSTSYGVRCLYWVGTIDGAGHFQPLYAEPNTLELPGMARDGFGLLSPSVYQHEGKTIALGIVPDKASSMLNYDLGYAHLYSFPREWSLDGEGNLYQRPYSGLQSLRTQGDSAFVRDNFTLPADEPLALDPVMGRAVELLAEFEVGEAQVGFELLKNSYGAMKVYIDPKAGTLTVDMSTIGRKANDTGVFDGLYRSVIPGGLAEGSNCKLQVLFDHSILDIFVNDRYATSIRVFPYDYSANGCTLYASNAEAKIRTVQAYGLGAITHYVPNTTLAVEHTTAEQTFPCFVAQNTLHYEVFSPSVLRVYSLSGQQLLAQQIFGKGTLEIPYSGIVVVRLDNNTIHAARTYKL